MVHQSRHQTQKPKSTISVSPERFSLSLPADQAATVGEQLRQLFSPVIEAAGLVGDYINFFRQAAAIRAMKRVREISSINKIELKPVPPKFLIPWIEGVSLESPSSTLIDWWANLLISTARSRTTRPYLVELMKQLGHDEAITLNDMWTKYSSNSICMVKPHLLRPHLVHEMDEEFAKIFGRESAHDARTWWKETAAALRMEGPKYVDVADKFGIYMSVMWISIRANEHYQEVELTPPVHTDTNYLTTLEVCRALNLLDYQHSTHEFSVVGAFKSSIQIKTFHFSPLGREFMQSCRPSRAPANDGSDDQLSVERDGIDSIDFSQTNLFVGLADGRMIEVPLKRYGRLKRASARERERYVAMPMSIHWPKLDLHLDVAELSKQGKVADRDDRSIMTKLIRTVIPR